MLTGEKFTAATAVRLGLLSDAADTEAELDGAIQQVVRDLQANGPEAVRKTKRLIGRVTGRDERLAEVKDFTVDLIADIRVSAEGQDGIASFLERRPPRWKEGAPKTARRDGAS
jgi:methylglutaconyl-CoA hydratase